MTRGLVLVLALVGCRIGGPADAVESPDGGSSGPPVVAGDTARVDTTRAAVADPPAPRAVESPSGLVLPVDGIRPEDLVDTFEAARSEGRVHNAIDILAPRGTPVRAAVDGEIVRLFTSDKGGLTVYQIGAEAVGGRVRVYYYAHLDAYAEGLAEGQTVQAGEAIGTVGDSGNAAPGNTHLHFAIWDASDRADFWNGDPVNPYGLLAP